jgi:TPR repeat protein
MYANGRGITRDLQQAIEWYRSAAQQGNQTAIDNLRSADPAVFREFAERQRQAEAERQRQAAEEERQRQAEEGAR